MRTSRRLTLALANLVLTLAAVAAEPDAVLERWEQEWTLQPDGTQVYHELRHVRINDERAHGEFADPRITYNADTDTVEVLVARTRRPDGTCVALPDYADLEVGPDATAGWPAFAGLRQRLLVMSGLEPGCLVELEYRVTTRAGARPFLAADVRLDHRYPVRARVLRVKTPPDVPLSTFVRRPGVPAEHESDPLSPGGGEWTYRDLPAAPEEPQSPPWQVRCPRIAFSTAGFGTRAWEQQRLARLEAAAQLDGELRRVAHEWTAGRDGAERLRALQEKLAATLAVVDFDAHWRPETLRPAPEVLRSSYSTPDEATALLLALARAAGLPVRPALIVSADPWSDYAPQDAWVLCTAVGLVPDTMAPSPGEESSGHRRVASASPAAHAAPSAEQPSWHFDARSELWDVRYGRLTGQPRLMRTHVLPRAPTGRDAPEPLPVDVPVDYTAATQRGLKLDLALREDGTFSGDVALSARGALIATEPLRTADAQRGKVSEWVGRVLPDAQVDGVSVTRLTDGVFEATAKIRSSKPLRKLGDTWCLTLGPDGPTPAEVPLPLAYGRRLGPVWLAGPFVEQLTLTVELPTGWEPAGTLPELRAGGGDAGPWSVEQRATRDGPKWTLTRRTSIGTHQLPAGAWGPLRASLNTLRSEAGRTLLVRPAPAP